MKKREISTAWKNSGNVADLSNCGFIFVGFCRILFKGSGLAASFFMPKSSRRDLM
jgi:hypothetical protein